jgi:hypothetical protein
LFPIDRQTGPSLFSIHGPPNSHTRADFLRAKRRGRFWTPSDATVGAIAGGRFSGRESGLSDWFYAVVLTYRLWTLVPHNLRANMVAFGKVIFGIYIVWYLLQPEARRAFQPFQPLPGWRK